MPRKEPMTQHEWIKDMEEELGAIATGLYIHDIEKWAQIWLDRLHTTTPLNLDAVRDAKRILTDYADQLPSYLISKMAGNIIMQENRATEDLILHYMKETGCTPSELCVCHQVTPTGAKLWVERRQAVTIHSTEPVKLSPCLCGRTATRKSHKDQFWIYCLCGAGTGSRKTQGLADEAWERLCDSPEGFPEQEES
jgi:hypothetical protein